MSELGLFCLINPALRLTVYQHYFVYLLEPTFDTGSCTNPDYFVLLSGSGLFSLMIGAVQYLNPDFLSIYLHRIVPETVFYYLCSIHSVYI